MFNISNWFQSLVERGLLELLATPVILIFRMNEWFSCFYNIWWFKIIAPCNRIQLLFICITLWGRCRFNLRSFQDFYHSWGVCNWPWKNWCLTCRHDINFADYRLVSDRLRFWHLRLFCHRARYFTKFQLSLDFASIWRLWLPFSDVKLLDFMCRILEKALRSNLLLLRLVADPTRDAKRIHLGFLTLLHCVT